MRTSVGVGDVACAFALTAPRQKTLGHRKLVAGIVQRIGSDRADAERGIRLALLFGFLARRGRERYRLA